MLNTCSSPYANTCSISNLPACYSFFGWLFSSVIMSPPLLYYLAKSPPCRSVKMLADTLNIQLDFKVINTLAKEQLKPSFVKINPQHTIPTLDDNGFILWESRAIMAYLVGKYGKDDSLYPKDLHVRAKVDQMLYFDIGTFYQRFLDYLLPVLFNKMKPDDEKFKRLNDAAEMLDLILKDRLWVAADTITIADYSLLVTVSCSEAIGLDLSKFPNVSRWFVGAQETISSYQVVNEEEIQSLQKLFEGLTNSSLLH